MDAVITGIDLLAEELDVMHRTLDQQVAERTARLDRPAGRCNGRR